MCISSSDGAGIVQPLAQLFRQFEFPGPAHPQRIDQREDLAKSGVGFHRRRNRTVKRFERKAFYGPLRVNPNRR